MSSRSARGTITRPSSSSRKTPFLPVSFRSFTTTTRPSSCSVPSTPLEWSGTGERHVVSPRQTQEEGREVVQFKRAVPCGVERGRRPLLFAFEEHGAKEPERRGGLQVRSRRTACTPHHSTARRLRFVASAEYFPLLASKGGPGVLVDTWPLLAELTEPSVNVRYSKPFTSTTATVQSKRRRSLI